MKQKSLLIKIVFHSGLFAGLILIVSGSYAQQVPELIFSNPVLERGKALKDGSKYRFSNATAGIDAIGRDQESFSIECCYYDNIVIAGFRHGYFTKSIFFENIA